MGSALKCELAFPKIAPSETELAWAAGFFDGEGCVRFRTCKSRPNRSREYGVLSIQVSQVHREPLDRFRAAVGVGTVKGPYGPYKTTKQAYFSYSIVGKNAIEAFGRLRPYLSPIKLREGNAALDAYNIQIARPKLGNGLLRRRELQALRAIR